MAEPLSNRMACTLAAVVGALWVIAFPGYSLGGWSFWWVGLVAPVPFLVVLEDAARRRGWRSAVLRALAFGTTFYGLSLLWLVNVHWLVPLPALLLQLLHTAFLGFVLHRTFRSFRRLPRTLLVPIVWTGCDVLRGAGRYGFPWYQPSLTLPPELDLVQFADVIGALGLSFGVSALHGLLLDGWNATRGRTSWIVVAGGALALGAAIAFGSLRGAAHAERLELEPGPSVLVVQANIAQELKNDANPEGAAGGGNRERLERILRAHIEITASQIHLAPDLVVWGETMYPQDLSNRRNRRDTSRIAELIRQMNASFVIGGFRFEPHPRDPERWQLYNAVFFFDPRAPENVFHLRDAGYKRQLVPGGEFIPFSEIPGVMPAIESFVEPQDLLTHLQHGREPVRFHLRTQEGEAAPFGIFVCYESFFPSLVQDLVLPAPPSTAETGQPRPAWPGAQFLVNLSNEGWFRWSVELDQHLVVARLRAIETRRSVVRATNTGITAFIDPTGALTSILTDENGQDRMVEGVLAGTPPLCHELTFFARHGHAFPWLAALAMLLLALRPPRIDKGSPQQEAVEPV